MSFSLWLVRHGLSTDEVNMFISTRPKHPAFRDSELTPLGFWQVYHSLDEIKCPPATVIYSSPMRPAVDTARLIAKQWHLPMFVDARLGPKRADDDEEGQPLATDLDYFGETQDMMRVRLRAFLKDYGKEKAIIVSHALPLHLLLGLLGRDEDGLVPGEIRSVTRQV